MRSGKKGSAKMAELKPCPFCGGVAHLDFASAGNMTYINNDGFAASTPMLYITFCENCFMRTIPCESTEVAIALWNRRADNG